MGMVLMHTYVTESQIDALKTEAKKTGLTRSEVLRRAIDCYFVDQKNKPGRGLRGTSRRAVEGSDDV